MRKVLLSSAAAFALCAGQAEAQSYTTFFDGYEFLVQWGPTPDQLQSLVGFSEGDVVNSDSQIYSAILATSLSDFMIHKEVDGTPVEVSYATLVESNFPGTNLNGLWLVLHDGGSGANGWVDIEVFMCSDAQCSNWLWADTDSGDGSNGGAFPIDGNVYNLQVTINPMTGTVSYHIDGVEGTSGNGFPNMNVVEFTGSFEEPIAGMYWAVGGDGSYYDWSQIWASTYRGLMDQVFLYSGPFPVYDQPSLNQSFYNVQGSLVLANELGTGIGVFGTMPTLYLHHDPNAIVDNNASFFAGFNPPPVQPFYEQAIYDPEGNTGGLGWDTRWPY